MQLLYPANPMRPREPDELYAEEYAAAVESDYIPFRLARGVALARDASELALR